MNPLLLAMMLGTALLAAADAADAQVRMVCESRNYQYQFCAVSDNVSQATLVSQRSRSPCVEQQSWGWDRRGVWVSRGCEAEFELVTSRPPPPAPLPGAGIVSCESRNYQYEFCGVSGVISASLVRQKSRSPCVLGRTWGWRQNGVWVSEGCEADIQVQSSYRPTPAPPGPNVLVCESHEYRYNFCATGPIRSAQLVNQVSQAPCIQGRTWGYQREGIWVDNGCEGAFRVNPR